MNNQLITIENRHGFSVMGKLCSNKKLGRFEVKDHSNPKSKIHGVEYSRLSDAQHYVTVQLDMKRQEEEKRKDHENERITRLAKHIKSIH